MKRFTKYQIASCVFLLAFVLGTAADASARELGFWEVVIGYIEIFAEMCAIRHPLGHAAFFDWHLPAVHAAALSGVQWLGMAATGAIVAVWMKRR